MFLLPRRSHFLFPSCPQLSTGTKCERVEQPTLQLQNKQGDSTFAHWPCGPWLASRPPHSASRCGSGAHGRADGGGCPTNRSTRAQIADLYERHRRGAYVDREAEWAARKPTSLQPVGKGGSSAQSMCWVNALFVHGDPLAFRPTARHLIASIASLIRKLLASAIGGAAHARLLLQTSHRPHRGHRQTGPG